jgi:Domain of unknown function (DUF4335)
VVPGGCGWPSWIAPTPLHSLDSFAMTAAAPALTAHTFEFASCTLAISLQPTTRSRWLGGSQSADLEFDLQGHSPDQPETKLWQIRGNLAHLQVLSTIVEDYVQQLLAETADRLTLNMAPFPWGISTPAQTEEEPGENFHPANELFSSNEIWLQPQSLLQHELYLGGLASEEIGDRVNLTVSQLFDLASALEAWPSADELGLSPPPRSWMAATPIWLRSTAIAALVIAVTTAALKFTQQPFTSNTLVSQQAKEQRADDPTPLGIAPPSPLPGATLVPPGTNPPAASAPPRLPSSQLSPPSGLGTALPPISLGPSESLPIPPPPPITLPPPPPISQVPYPMQPPAGMPPTRFNAESESAAPWQRPESLNDGTVTGSARKTLTSLPQVSEVQAYFAQRWQPPAELSQTLEYSLILNPDGSLQRVIPLGRSAAVFIDRTPIPLANEPFVSPLSQQKSTIIRLVLEKSGRVQAFLE